MPLTITTIENVTTITGTGTATDVFVPSKAEIGRYRIRVVRFTLDGTVAVGDGVVITGITPKPADGTAETQTLWQSKAPTTAPYTDQTSFPDEHEWRGRIQVAITSAAGTPLLILYHG